jgi:carbohydrate kinase (thermoresistant glucokinase family)
MVFGPGRGIRIMKRNIVVMGVSGSGKTTIGEKLSEELDMTFFDGDDFHTAENIRKMKDGIALTDEDRKTWLDVLHHILVAHRRKGCVMACSALKESYRKKLSIASNNPLFVYLNTSFDLAQQRLNERKDHFMPTALLQSQFDTLEEPSNAIVVDASLPVDVIVFKVLQRLQNEH